MESSDFLDALAGLLNRVPTARPLKVNQTPRHDAELVAEWAASAHAILSGGLPTGHSLLASFERTRSAQHFDPQSPTQFAGLVGVVRSAERLVRDGPHIGVLEGVRTETVDEVLSQGETLTIGGYLTAATVLAGGALETHLRHLCDRNNLVIHGDGSISKYDGAIAQARNAGTASVYSPTDSKQVNCVGRDEK